MDVDAALSEVPVNVMPLLDATDFKTVEVAVAYDAAGMDLRWNFVTTGGAYTSTAVTPTTAGDYDWAHQGDGMYSIEIPASAGASINNDTEGFGWFTGVATGVLPWRGPVIGFRAAALNNSLVDGAASLSTLDAAGVRTAIGLASANLDTQLDALPTAAEIVAALDAAAMEGAITHAQAWRIMLAALSGKSSGHSTNAPKYRDVADTKNRIDATTTADGRTAVTLDGT